MADFPHRFRSRVRLVRQSAMSDCGLACAAMIAGAYGYNVTLAELAKQHPPSMRGMSLRQVMNVLSSIGFEIDAVRFEMEGLKEIELPAILHWGHNHFVVLTKVTATEIVVLDPARGRRSYAISALEKVITGVALEVRPTARVPQRRRLHSDYFLKPIFDEVRGAKLNISKVILITLYLETVVVTVPMLFSHMFNAYANGHAGSKVGLVIFAVLCATVILWVLKFFRSVSLIQLSKQIKFSFMSKLIPKLLGMPFDFFAERSASDVLFRLGGVDKLRETLSEETVSVVADALMAVAILIAISLMNFSIAAGTLVGVALLAALKITLSVRSENDLDEIIHARGKESAFVYETLAAARTIKLFNREAERTKLWNQRIEKTLARETRHSTRNLVSNILPSAAADMLVVGTFIYELFVAKGNIGPIGTIFAVYVYQRILFDRCLLVASRIVQLGLLNVFLARIADILEGEEPQASGALQAAGAPAPLPIGGDLDLEGVSFQFDRDSRPLFADVSLKVRAGEFVAICGRSGVGKSTLIEIILGIRKPSEGRVFWDGMPIDAHPTTAFRRSVVSVTQEDAVMIGSIEQNITFFAELPDAERMQRAAEIAEFARDIEQTPLKYATPVGEGGCALSGGERQRLLLARALYEMPKVMIIDEGTSELDPATEAAIYRKLAALGITLIVVAHRRETIDLASRVFHLRDGQLVEDVQHRYGPIDGKGATISVVAALA
jgi:ATP-binding cassette, subfamily B, bacterial CvaB/MchF/RaxB